MENALYGLIVSLLLLNLCNSCAGVASEQQSLADQQVELECSRGWLLKVQVDGSASLDYADARNCEVWLPSGSLPFKEISLLPAFAPRNLERYPFRWTYTALEEQDCRQYSLPDTAWAADWFEQAYKALELKKGGLKERRLQKYWQKSPPTGIKNTGSL